MTERWTLGSADGYNVNQVYNERGDGVLQVYGLPMNSRVSDPDLAAPMWAEGLRVGRLASAAPKMREALEHIAKHSSQSDLRGMARDALAGLD